MRNCPLQEGKVSLKSYPGDKYERDREKVTERQIKREKREGEREGDRRKERGREKTHASSGRNIRAYTK